MQNRSAASLGGTRSAALASTGDTVDNTENAQACNVFDAAEYRARARRYAPQTPEEIAAAAMGLAAQGYGDHTIAQILEMDANSARRLIVLYRRAS